jgi:predicted metalloprotease
VQGYRGQSAKRNTTSECAFGTAADYLAGVWANYVQEQGVLEAGDFEEALTQQQCCRDDTLQKQYKAMSYPTALRTALPSNGCAGSRKALRPVI